MSDAKTKVQPGVSVCAAQTRTYKEFSATYFPRFAGCFFGLIAIRIWIQCCLYDRYTATDSGVLTLVANFARVALIVILLLLASQKGFTEKQQKLLSWFSVTAMTLAAILYLLQIEFPALPLSFVACICAGLGIVWGGGMWIRFYVRLEPGEALIYAFACLGLSSILGFFLGLLPPVIVYVIAIFMPTLSLVSYWQAMSTLDERKVVIPEPYSDSLYDKEPKHVIVRLLVGIVLLEFALGVARGFPFGGSIPLSVPLQGIHQLGVLILSFGIIWWVLVRGRGLRFASVWRFQILLMVVGVLLISTLEDSYVSWGALLITVSNTLMLGVLWYCVYDFARHSSVPSYVILGVVWLVHLLPRELGRWLIFKYGPHTDGSMVAVAVMICLLALSMAFVLRDSVPTLRPLFAEFASSSYSERFLDRVKYRGDREAGYPETAGVKKGKSTVEPPILSAEKASTQQKADSKHVEMQLAQRCQNLQEEYKLTNRETDMVRFIAQGRSKGYISNKLYISENTVKGYTRNVYHKLCVHSKQELLDALYAEEDPFGSA